MRPHVRDRQVDLLLPFDGGCERENARAVAGLEPTPPLCTDPKCKWNKVDRLSELMRDAIGAKLPKGWTWPHYHPEKDSVALLFDIG